MFLILLILLGYRETAFLYAIQSAGVAHSITIACHLGMFAKCRCISKKKRRQRKLAQHEKRNLHYNGNIFDWSDSCLDRAISFGKGMSRKVMSNSQGRDVRAMVDRHNKEAGRQVGTRISNSMIFIIYQNHFHTSLEESNVHKPIPTL